MDNSRLKKLPAKIQELAEHPSINTVNEMIDYEMSLRQIKEYLASEGFDINLNYIGDYRKYYRSISAEEKELNKFFNGGNVGRIALENNNKKPLSKKDKLKTDFEFIDLVIQAGAKNLHAKMNTGDNPVDVEDVFRAIELKDKLTEGAYKGLTDYGISYLQQITEEKYIRLINVMFSYIQKNKHREVIRKLQETEMEFYKQTDYYEEYLKSQGLSAKRISDLLNERELDNNTNN